MSDEELVKRLRSWAKDIQEGSTAIYAMDLDLKNAASSIEALTEARDTMGHLWAKEAAEKQVALGRIEALTAERDRLSSEVDTLELLRPHWAQGYSSDSVAAQASTAALVAFWEILGVSDQTSAINALKALTATLAEIKGDKE
jgi:hypothetical protein